VPLWLRSPNVRVLWVVAMLLAAVVTGITLIPRDTPRDKVTRYIERANETGVAFAKQYKDVSAAYRSLSVAPSAQPAQSARLELAARHLTSLRLQLARLPAPAPARELRLRLIAFYRQQELVAHELAGIMAYFPQAIAAQRGVERSAARMRKGLAAADTPEAQAVALGHYADTLATARRRMRAIEAPPLLANAQRSEVARLTRTGKAIRAVQRSLLANSQPQLQRALKGLQSAVSVTSTATRVAILSYNRHITRIERLGRKVELERRRLNDSLGS
jgi:hypothetical protein